MPPVNRTFKPCGTGTAPSPNAKTIMPSISGNADSCSSSHGTFLFSSVSDAPPVTMTNASSGKSRCFRHSALSCGLKLSCRYRTEYHPAASLGYWASASDFGQPVTVCDHPRSTISVCPQFPRMRSPCQKSVCRPYQDRAWIASFHLPGVPIAATIKKAASGHVPHIVDTDHDADSARQCLHQLRNVEPIGHRVKMHHIHSFQIRGRWRRQQSQRSVPRFS